MSVDDVRSGTGRHQAPDVRGVDSIEWDDVGARLTDESGEANLPFARSA
jgi:hypothetical protein